MSDRDDDLDELEEVRAAAAELGYALAPVDEDEPPRDGRRKHLASLRLRDGELLRVDRRTRHRGIGEWGTLRFAGRGQRAVIHVRLRDLQHIAAMLLRAREEWLAQREGGL